MRLIGQDRQPLDLTREDHLQVFQKSVGTWAQGMADNADNSKYGYPYVEGAKLEPYGTAYA